MNYQTVRNILLGKAHEAEKEVFFNELERDSEKKREFIRLKKIWDLHQIAQIKLSQEKKQQSFRNFWVLAHKKEQKPALRYLFRISKYAAVILLALFTGYYISIFSGQTSGNKNKKFHSEYGNISNITLEDGSEIWLNSNTTLVLHEKRKKVTVDLRGEAYFEIRHDPKRVFVVNLGKIRIKDIGTKFNVSAYPQDEFFRTTLLNGGIVVYDSNKNEIKKITENQTFSFDPKNLSYKVEKLDPMLVTGWTKNKFVFIDKPLADICHEFEKWYGVSILIENEQLKQERYTSVIRRTATIKQLMEMFKLTTGITYKFKNEDDENVIISIE